MAIEDKKMLYTLGLNRVKHMTYDDIEYLVTNDNHMYKTTNDGVCLYVGFNGVTLPNILRFGKCKK